MLPTDKNKRKHIPIGTFLKNYFPDALAYVAYLSWKANEQHNPGEPMYWARGKSMDHADCLIRHFLEAGTLDDDNLLHTGKVAWRGLAMLQEEIEDLLKNDVDPYYEGENE